MADVIDYSSYFNRLRDLVNAFFKIEKLQTNTAKELHHATMEHFPFPYLKNVIVDTFETAAETDEVGTIEADFETAIASLGTLKASVLGFFENVLADMALELGEYKTTTPAAILDRLADAMKKDSQFIKARETEILAADLDITTPTRTADAASTTVAVVFANVDYTALYTVGNYLKNITDGTWHKITASAYAGGNTTVDVTPPSTTAFDTLNVPVASKIAAHTDNVGTGKLVFTFDQLPSELAPNETSKAEFMHCECVAASTPGNESFQLSGEKDNGRESHLGQGSGLGPTLGALGTSLTNGDFEDWSGSPLAADNWSAVSGTWATDMQQNSASELEGTYCLEGIATKVWKIAHSVTLNPNTLYNTAVWIKKETAATGELKIGLIDETNNWVPGCYFEVLISELSATDYHLLHCPIKVPGNPNTSWRFCIERSVVGTLAVYLDLAQFGQMTNFNGINFAMCSGAANFGVEDKFGYGGDHVGFQVHEVHTTYTDNGAGDTDTVIFDENIPNLFAPGNYVKNPTDGTWHEILSSAWVAETTVEVTPVASTSFLGLVVDVPRASLQEFIGRCFDKQLPSDYDASVTQADP